MSKEDGFSGAARELLDGDEVQGVLSGAFYAPESERRAKHLRGSPKPEHYKVICISLYNEDLESLDAKVEALKARGLTKASRSALIRYALEHVDLAKVPRGL